MSVIYTIGRTRILVKRPFASLPRLPLGARLGSRPPCAWSQGHHLCRDNRRSTYAAHWMRVSRTKSVLTSVMTGCLKQHRVNMCLDRLLSIVAPPPRKGCATPRVARPALERAGLRRQLSASGFSLPRPPSPGSRATRPGPGVALARPGTSPRAWRRTPMFP